MEARSLKAGDLLAVRSRVAWAAIAAGAVIAVAVYVILTLLGVGLGVEVAVRGTTAQLAGAHTSSKESTAMEAAQMKGRGQTAAAVMTPALWTCSVFRSVLEASLVFRDAGCGTVHRRRRGCRSAS